MDRTASYLILSDVKNRGLYVLQVQLDYGDKLVSELEPNKTAASKLTAADDNNVLVKADTGADVNVSSSAKSSTSSDTSSAAERSIAYIKSVSEFPLSSPILSFGLVDAAVRKYKCAFNDSYLIDELDDYDEENHLLYCVVIHMFVVQPKSVQECHVLYQPSVSEDVDVRGSVSDEHRSGYGVNDSSSSSNDAEPSPVALVTSKVPEIGAAAVVEKQSPALAHLDADPSPLKQASPKFKRIDAAAVPLVEVANNTPSKPAAAAAPIKLITPDSFQSPPGLSTPEGVSSEVRSTLRMLAQAQSPAEIKRKSAETVKLLQLVSTQINAEQEQHQKALLRQSVELNSQILGEIVHFVCTPIVFNSLVQPLIWVYS